MSATPASRTMIGSIPKYSASPPHTPPITRSLRERKRRRGPAAGGSGAAASGAAGGGGEGGDDMHRNCRVRAPPAPSGIVPRGPAGRTRGRASGQLEDDLDVAVAAL